MNKYFRKGVTCREYEFMKKALGISIFALLLLSTFSIAMPIRAGDTTVNYGNVALSGGYQAGHFSDVWDLTQGDIVISFTYDANGLVDDAGAHAWAELGVRDNPSAYKPGTSFDFNPTGKTYTITTGQKTVDLLAGQNIDVGDIIVTREGNTLTVKYCTTGDWLIIETHLAVNDSLSKIPQTKKGSPIPGQFPYGGPLPEATNCVEYTIDVTGLNCPLYIAAHAIVVKMCERPVIVGYTTHEESLTVASNTTAEWSADGTDWDPAVACWVHPSWPSITGATWIWRTEVTNPDEEYANVPEGGWYFQQKFTLPSNAYGITATAASANGDNAYRIAINGQPLDPDGQGAMSKDGPDNQEWNDIKTHDIPDGAITTGDNYLQLRALNYFDSTHHPPGDYPYGDGYANPAGLSYKLTVDYKWDEPIWGTEKYVCQKETAWGNGLRFKDLSVWATYITLQCAPETRTVKGVWLATDYDWTPNTFDLDVTPTLDLDDKLILQRVTGQGEGAYNLPSTPPAPGNNHRVWWDRDGVDPWQNGETANTGGIYQVEIHLSATSATTGTAYLKINGLWQGFETDGNWGTIELTPAGMTFEADMHNLVVFYGLYGYGATHSVEFRDITVTQTTP